MTSYVSRKDTRENSRHRERHQWEEGAETGRVGEVAVVAHEKDKEWFAVQMETNNAGYDVASSPAQRDGLPDMDHPEARYIEVKSTKNGWDAYGVAISGTQFEMAREMEGSWWLYVVEYVDSAGQVIHEVPNPLVDSGLSYRFDGGWARWAEQARDSLAATLPEIAPEQDPRVGRSFQQRQRNGRTWTFRVLTIGPEAASGRIRAKVQLASGQKKTIHSFENWEPLD